MKIRSILIFVLLASCATKPIGRESDLKFNSEREPAGATKTVACVIDQVVDGNSYRFELLGTDANSIGLRVTRNAEQPVEMNLKPTSLLLGGYKFEGSEYKYILGWRVEAILIFLNSEGFDFKIRAKNSIWGSPIESYKFCRR